MIIREMRDSEADQVARMVHDLARHLGDVVTPKVTGTALREARDLIDIIVAEEAGALAGACLGLMTYSTWRGTRGLYIVDLFVDERLRGHNVGRALLRESARRAAARGARFIKLEVDVDNLGATRFYVRLGFHRKKGDSLFFLEQDQLKDFIATGEGA